MNLDVTVTEHNSLELADLLNTMFDDGKISTVNGRELVSRFGRPVARSWQNGTVSVTVRARAQGKTNDLFVKVGATLTAR